MRFQEGIEERQAKRVPPDVIKAKSLIVSSEQAIATAARIPNEPTTRKSIVRELYEGLRQYCEAIGLIHGYKFATHEIITAFLEDVLKEPRSAARFDRYRKLRNGINYYGDDVSPETVNEALTEIPTIIKHLSNHTKSKPS